MWCFARFVVASLALLLAAPAAAADPSAAVQGYWLGAEQGFPLKRALLATYVAERSAHAASGDGRYGSTGFKDLRTVPPVVRWSARREGDALHVSVAERLHLRALPGGRLEGEVRYPHGTRRIIFERVPDEAALQTASFNREALPATPVPVTVAFLSTPDCPACRWWIANRRDAFQGSATAQAVRYVEIKGANLRAGVQPGDWPAELRPLAEQVGPGRQPVPSFIVVAGQEVLFRQFGALYWETRVEPLLRELVRIGVARR